jgi:hypothetical protein
MKKVIATVAAFMLVVGLTTVNAQDNGKKKEGEKKEAKGGEKKGEKKEEKKGEKKEEKPKN